MSAISLEGEGEGLIGEGTGRHGRGPIGEQIALEAQLVLEETILEKAVLAREAGGSLERTGRRIRVGGGELGQSLRGAAEMKGALTCC